MLIVCHRSSLLILDCISSITPSNGEASLLGEDSEAELLPCFSMTILHWRFGKTQNTGKSKTHASNITPFINANMRARFIGSFKVTMDSKYLWLVES